jgi:hypothetical protein
MINMQSASPTPAGIDQQTACDATSVDFTGEFKWDWKPTANAGTQLFATATEAFEGLLALDRRYRVSGHPPATGYGQL